MNSEDFSKYFQLDPSIPEGLRYKQTDFRAPKRAGSYDPKIDHYRVEFLGVTYKNSDIITSIENSKTKKEEIEQNSLTFKIKRDYLKETNSLDMALEKACESLLRFKEDRDKSKIEDFTGAVKTLKREILDKCYNNLDYALNYACKRVKLMRQDFEKRTEEEDRRNYKGGLPCSF
jgi:hypothetical protein